MRTFIFTLKTFDLTSFCHSAENTVVSQDGNEMLSDEQHST